MIQQVSATSSVGGEGQERAVLHRAGAQGFVKCLYTVKELELVEG